ncbi:tRNA (adenosine(37)-N6)-threonylcarbamoyltransferase complex dimerization subunit type 1 TsaB [Georgenia alba]|uniref:tRNA (Adenosine(37)-N6)-threonylcarbamoyltransferase complex dimerization subunit type 1 TsaB n=1 Tax=Georgenia alba TaxID=2233858 RepID=A0ABW2QFW8_9MICO
MLILAIDTSAGSAAALVETTAGGPFGTAPGGSDPALAPLTVHGRADSRDPRKHAELLAPLVAGLLEGRTAVDLVAVGTGPAPFTGLRAGIVTARAFAHGRRIPVHGVASLDVLARQALDARAASGDGEVPEVLTVTDARRREVYWARYRAAGTDDVERLAGPEVAPPAAVAEQHAQALVGGLLLAGSGTRLYPELLPGTPDLPETLDPAVLARVVLSRLARRDRGEDPELGLEPRYLRRPDVHVPGGAKRVS